MPDIVHGSGGRDLLSVLQQHQVAHCIQDGKKDRSWFLDSKDAHKWPLARMKGKKNYYKSWQLDFYIILSCLFKMVITVNYTH